MANWHMKRCLTLLISREMQAKITMRYHLSSVAQSCLAFCDLLDYSMPGLPVDHQLLELAQTHVHRVGDTIQISHPLLFPSPPAFIQSLSASGSFLRSQFFASGGQSIGVSVSPSVLPMNIQD